MIPDQLTYTLRYATSGHQTKVAGLFFILTSLICHGVTIRFGSHFTRVRGGNYYFSSERPGRSVLSFFIISILVMAKQLIT
nr:MAG TPA: hypothetical protein [Caudoviricetes sp.]